MIRTKVYVRLLTVLPIFICAETAIAQSNTNVGVNSLAAITSGVYNSAFGNYALWSTTTGNANAAVGYGALPYNTTGSNNTAVGAYALFANVTSSYSTATGYAALYVSTAPHNSAFGAYALEFNTTGANNSALGYNALLTNSTGSQNTAVGTGALYSNTTASYNTASGNFALYLNTTGDHNNAAGYSALYHNTTGAYNNAMGVNALFSNTTGSNNTAMGQLAGYYLTTGSNNIDIGNKGKAGDNALIRIGTAGTQTAIYVAGVSGVNVTGGAQVVVNSLGQLGVVSSSIRYKEDVRPMGDVSDRLLALRPVTFRYKKSDENGRKPEQFGLIAEEVAKVMPELVVYNQKGQPETVAYQTLAPLLVNELQREHARAEQQADALKAMQKELSALKAEVASLHRPSR